MCSKTKILTAAVAACFSCGTLFAADIGFVAKLGLGSTNLDTEVSAAGFSSSNSDSGGTFEIYGGYRMPNAQFGLSYTNINCEDCDANYIMASGAYVYEGFDIAKPFIGLGLGMFSYEESGFFDESGLFGTVNLGVNAEFEHFFIGAEFRQRIFGEAEGGMRYSGYNFNAKVQPNNTYLLNVGYKF
ncbi:MAG: porin family protein [Campylobacteraceae bacterium]|nr:porin family protein [Campylobacteraceae bacterium]